MPERSILEHHHLALIAGVAILVLVLVAMLPRPSFISPYALPATPAPPSPSLSPSPVPPSQAEPDVASAWSPIFANLTPDGAFDTLVENNLYSSERSELAAEVEQAYAFVSQRIGARASARFKAAFAIEEQCSLHGITRADERMAQVYSCNGIPRARAVAIMAHEFGHQLEYDYYGPQHLSADQLLSEGLATWAAGTYWLGGHPDFRSYVRDQRQGGALDPLATNASLENVAAMNRLYYQWASFVDFLITTYGRQQFDKLYLTGQVSAGSADYAGVYGKDLNALEQEWQAWLDG